MLRRIVTGGVLTALVAAGILSTLTAGSGSTDLAFAQGRSQVAQFLAQLRRNAKVSERLNAAFFRAPQTRQFVGAAFVASDSDTAYTADRGDSSLSLDATRQVVRRENENDPTSPLVLENVAQTSGSFEIPLDIPNRAQVTEVQTSYADATGNNTTVGGQQQPSGFQFQIVRYGQLGDQGTSLLSTRSTDGKTGTDTTQLGNNAFRVDNSRNRYALRVTITDTAASTRFYGMTIQYVLGRGVPGAPTS